MLTILIPTVAVCLGAAPTSQPVFLYDPADRTVAAWLLDEPNAYDASVLSADDGLLVTWLEYVPGEGDRLCVGGFDGSAFGQRTVVIDKPGECACPTLTRDGAGRVWLTYEARVDGQWDILIRRRQDDGRFGEPRPISTSRGQDIRHRTAATPDGLWIVWMSDRRGQFDIMARELRGEDLREVQRVTPELPNEEKRSDAQPGPLPLPNDWDPDIAINADGQVCVTWDAYDGDSYKVHFATLRDGKWMYGAELATGGPAGRTFEARARMAAQGDRFWVAWEQGDENYGRPYRARRGWKDATDTAFDTERGPLHRSRRIRFGVIQGGRTVVPHRTEMELPMPSLEAARRRPGGDGKLGTIGAFYEAPRITFDRRGRLWIVYRHQYLPWLGVEPHHHVAEPWGIYARCYTADGWSELLRVDVGQGDAGQRLEVAPHGDGVAVVLTTGRTDRRKNPPPRGVAVALLRVDGEAMASTREKVSLSSVPSAYLTLLRRPRDVEATVGDRKYTMLLGDLHRHTDLSLCFTPSDGSLDDAYRYAMDVAQLDFLGVTDHTHDLVMGEPLSQLWWRCTKEVTRMDLGERFIPVFAYERSRGETDHNVLSLQRWFMRPHTYPHEQFWKEIDENTITIGHQPVNSQTWRVNDAGRRPLLEIYQGLRDTSAEPQANEGLSRGYLLGFIASSDHLSTSASYAGVWATERTREALFAAIKARHTFGATDHIEVLVRSGNHMMGDVITGRPHDPLTLTARGTAPIVRVEVVLDGEVAARFEPNTPEAELTFPVPNLPAGLHYAYFRLEQSDGNRAWSSPIWFDFR